MSRLPPPPPGMMGSGRPGLPPPPPGMGGSSLPPPPPGMRSTTSGMPPQGAPYQQQHSHHHQQYQQQPSIYPPRQEHSGAPPPNRYPQPPHQSGGAPMNMPYPPAGGVHLGGGGSYDSRPQQGNNYADNRPPHAGGGYDNRPQHGNNYGDNRPPHAGGGYDNRPQHGNNYGDSRPPHAGGGYDNRPPQDFDGSRPQQGRYPQPPYGGGPPPHLSGMPHHSQHHQPQVGGYGERPSYTSRPQYPPQQQRQYETREATNTVWVGNLEPHHTDDVLRNEFAPFGRIMRIARVDGKNFLFVHFRQKDEAQSAVQTLSQNGALGRARFNYGKQFDYSAEELDLPWDPHHPHQFFGGVDRGGAFRGSRDPQDGGDANHRGGDFGDRRPPKRSRDEEATPTNVLWAANIPPTLSTDELRQNFESFGNITSVSRINERNMAFIHFTTIEQCQHALDVMRGQPVGGVVLTLNYGRPPRNDNNNSTGDAANLHENATNVVYLGNIASNVSHDEVDRLFDQYEGFINAKYISGSGIAFGHFDTIENSRACRVALQGQLLGGAPFRVNFGKSNHTMTIADRRPGGAASGGGMGGGVDISTIDPFNAGALFALSTTNPSSDGGASDPFSGALTIPAMGSSASGALVLSSGPSVPKFFTRDRPAPIISFETRLVALQAATYHNCGEQEKNLRPNVVLDICNDIDNCIDSETEAKLDTEISYFSPLNASHCFAIAAKRLKEYFNDDRHKKLLVMYACARVLFGTRTSQLTFSKHTMWSFLMLISIVSAEQDSAGLDQVRVIVDKLKTASAFYIANHMDDGFVQEYQEQLDTILQRANADQEMAQFAKRRRK